MLQTQNPYSRERIDALTATLAGMDARDRQAYAAQHKNDPAVISVALNVNNIISAAERSKAMQAGMGAKPTIVDQEIANMASLPEEQGIARLPTPNIKSMAEGGIAGYDEGGMADGGSMFDFSQRSEPVIRMAEGGMKKLSGADLFETALKMEGVTDPAEIAFLKSIHGQESGGKATSKDSNRGAKGAMQVMPDTFKSVADPDMDIAKPLDNMRAGIRYGRQGFNAAKGDPVLAGAYYYGGPGGMQKAMKGVAVSDPKNPNAPTTIGYGQSIAQRMASLLPIGSAQASEKAPYKGETATDRQIGPDGTSYAAGAAGLGSLLGGKLGAMEANLGKLNNVLTPATRAGIAAPAVGMGTGVGLIGGALSGGAANALSNATPEQLSQLQGDIGSDTGLAAAIMNPENRKPQAVIPTNTAENQSAAETARLLRQNQPVKDLPPEIKKEALATAKEEIPKDTLLGFGRDDVIMFGLQLMAGQSPNLLQNVGTAGIGTLAAKQAREKAAADKELAQAHKEYYSASGAKARAEADYLASGARGMGAVAKTANEIFDNMMASLGPVEKMEMTPAKRQQMQNQALAQAAKLYKIDLPEGMGTPATNTSDPLGILNKKG